MRGPGAGTQVGRELRSPGPAGRKLHSRLRRGMARGRRTRPSRCRVPGPGRPGWTRAPLARPGGTNAPLAPAERHGAGPPDPAEPVPGPGRPGRTKAPLARPGGPEAPLAPAERHGAGPPDPAEPVPGSGSRRPRLDESSVRTARWDGSSIRACGAERREPGLPRRIGRELRSHDPAGRKLHSRRQSGRGPPDPAEPVPGSGSRVPGPGSRPSRRRDAAQRALSISTAR